LPSPFCLCYLCLYFTINKRKLQGVESIFLQSKKACLPFSYGRHVFFVFLKERENKDEGK
jgi:hypothetical protein